MKRLVLFSIFILAYCSTFGQYNFVLNVKGKTMEGAKIYFGVYNNFNNPLRHDSTLVKNGESRFDGKINQQSCFAYLATIYKGKYIESGFIVESGENNITLELVDDPKRPLKLTSNTPGNLIYREFSDIIYRREEATKVNGVYQESIELRKQILEEQRKHLAQYPTNFTSLLLLYRLGTSDDSPEFANKILETLATFSNPIKKSALGKKLYDEKTELIKGIESSKAGNQVLKFSVNDINNNLFTNSSLMGQNYLIVFCATWCGPCQRQLPRLKEIYSQYKDKGLKVVYFNIDDNVELWKEHVLKNKLDWINVSERLKPEDSKIDKLFGLSAIPVYLLIDKRGVIAYNSKQSGLGLDGLNDYLKKEIK